VTFQQAGKTAVATEKQTTTGHFPKFIRTGAGEH